MWNLISGKSLVAKDDTPPRRTRRINGEERSKQSRSDSPVSTSSKKSASRGDRDRGFNPTSTSYSSTSQSPYPGAASASVATASGNHNDDFYNPPGLVRNASLADHMPKSRTSRDEREDDRNLDSRSERRRREKDNDKEDYSVKDERRQKKDRRDSKDKDWVKSSSKSSKSSRSTDVHGDNERRETSRGPADFSDQVAAVGFSQFPGQYNAGIPGAIQHANGHQGHHPMSSHVQDQFPGQFPDQSAAPYRPPAAAGEGGPGLAAEYYGDAGESVLEQPGNRIGTPSLIVGAEPHLQAASAVAAPPPEPSASGGVGAAASFFSSDFDDEVATSHDHQTTSTYTTAPIRPSGSHHTSSAPIIPTTGGAAMGAAAAYALGSQASSHTQRPEHAPSMVGPPLGYSSSAHQRPPSPTVESYYSNASRPSKPGEQSSHSSTVPVYAAGAAGVAGLATAAYQQSHYPSSQHIPSRPHHSPTMPMAQRHRHRGPFGAVVDFFKDPDGVAQFEEYSEIIGVCKYCFAPGSSPRDAPRKHHYRKRRSNESLSRVDKESRYHSSESKGRRKKDKSWLATGLAGYGSATVGENLFKQKNDFDDTYSVKTGRHSPEVKRHKSRRRSRSRDRVETGITSDGRVYKKGSGGGSFPDSRITTVETRRRSRSRSRSRDRKSNLADVAIGAAVGSAVAGSSSRQRRSDSPKGAFVKTKHRSEEHSPKRHRKSHKKKKDKGFFGLGSVSSSSSVDLAQGSDRRRSSKRSNNKSKDDKKAEAALLGLGAAAAALALKDGRNGHPKKGVKELVGVKETRDKHGGSSRDNRKSDEEVWESAPEEEYESADSALAYGVPKRRNSQDSLISESSGTDKWGWRWGSKKRRKSPQKRRSPDYVEFRPHPDMAEIRPASAVVMSPDQSQGDGRDSKNSLPLQKVFPIPTSDPTQFDVGRESSEVSYPRPGVVPIQHPQPITPVTAALYSSSAPYEHSYSAPVGPFGVSQGYHPVEPSNVEARISRAEFGIPGSFSQKVYSPKHVHKDSKPKRRDSSPARFGVDTETTSMTPRRRTSTKDDSATVRFDRTEEQEEDDRRERRRRRKEDKERREMEERDEKASERRDSRDKSGKKIDPRLEHAGSQDRPAQESWVAPAAAGVIGAAIGAAVVAERPKSEETKEERRERRRKEREREEADDANEASRRRERRQKERDENETTPQVMSKETPNVPDSISEARDITDRQGRTSEKRRSVWQEAANIKRSTSHEDYGTFFRPDLDDSDGQVKVTSTGPNADVQLDQSPAIVTVEPRSFRDRDAQPIFSQADTDDIIDPLEVPFPVPKLRLVEPTPPSSGLSTPLMQPKDRGDDEIEEPPRNPSPSKVTWGDDQTHEYTVISPDEEHQDPIESPSRSPDNADVVEPSKSSSTEWDQLVDEQQETQRSDTASSSKDPASYGDDIEFAATLAASAEDAGFDPSIVIDDPTYRRRDSPPGSSDQGMPGGFDDDDEVNRRLSKKDRKKKSRNNDPDVRDDDAVVQDIISQIEDEPTFEEPQEKESVIDNDWETSRKPKSKKSKKGRKESESRDEFYEAPESAGGPQESSSRDLYESPKEDPASMVSTASVSNNQTKKSRKKSKRNSTGFDDAASTVSSPSTVSGSNETRSQPKEKSKKSVWDRVLGRSKDNLVQENGAKENEANDQDFEEPKKKSKKSKRRQSTRDEYDDNEIQSTRSTSNDRSGKRESNGDSTLQDLGRITQDLPAKTLESSQSEAVTEGSISQHHEPDAERDTESFLDRRPEPPPPPNIEYKEEVPPDPFAGSDVPASPRSLSETPIRQAAEARPSDPLASPTAVPFDFRFSRPRPSLRSARSMSQTPSPSRQSFSAQAPRPKPRPRSTEFTSSKEFRPLMLVERHSSHQEPSPQEVYPSLPSSHTTSRSSSVLDPEEDHSNQKRDYEMTQTSHEPSPANHGMTVQIDDKTMQSDLLDSQQATPTATSFRDSTLRHATPPSPDSKDMVIQSTNDNDTPKQLDLRNVALGALVGGTAAFALDKATHGDVVSEKELEKGEKEQFQQGLDDMAPAADISGTHEDDIVHNEEVKLLEDIGVPSEEPLRAETEQDRHLIDTASTDTWMAQTHNDEPVVEEVLDPFQDAKASEEELARDGQDRIPEGQDDMNSDVNIPPTLDNDTLPNVKAPGVEFARDSLDPFPQGQDDVNSDVKIPQRLDDVALPEEDLDPRDDYAPQRVNKGKKGKRKASKPEDPRIQTSLPTPESAPNTTSLNPDQLSHDEKRHIQEQDAQDAVDSWFAPIESSKKSKKGKKRDSARELSEPTEPVLERADVSKDHSEFEKSTQPDQSKDITPDMNSEQIVDIMTAAAQGTHEPTEQLPPNATTSTRGIIENPLERRQSKSKGKKGKKGRKLTLEDDLPSGLEGKNNELDIPVVDPPREVLSQSPAPVIDVPEKSEAFGNLDSSTPSNLKLSEQTPHDVGLGNTPEGHEMLDQPMTSTLPDLAVSPEAIPLPVSEDLDLLEEQTQNPTLESIGQLDYGEPDIKLEILEDQSQAQETPSISEMNNETGQVGALGHEEAEIASEASLEHAPAQEPPAILEQIPHGLQEISSQQDLGGADDFSASPSKEIVKEADESVSVADDAPLEKDRNASALEQTLEPPDSDKAQTPMDPLVDVSQESKGIVEEEWAPLTGKKKGKKSKRSKQQSESDAIANAESETIADLSTTPPNIGSTRDLEASDHQDVVGMTQEEPRSIEDEWTGFSTRNKGKKGKKAQLLPAQEDEMAADAEILPISNMELSESQMVKDADPQITVDIPQQALVADDEWADLGKKKKSKKAMKATTSLTPEAEAAPNAEVLPVSKLESPESHRIDDADPQDTNDVTQAAKQNDDEWAGFTIKKKGGNGKKATKSSTTEIEAIIEEDVPPATSLEVVAESNQKETSSPQDTNESFQKSQLADEWADFSTKKKGKKAKKTGKSYTPDADMGEASEPLHAAPPATVENDQAADSGRQDKVDISQEELMVNEEDRAAINDPKKDSEDTQLISEALRPETEALEQALELDPAVSEQDIAVGLEGLDTSQSIIAASQDVNNTPDADRLQVMAHNEDDVSPSRRDLPDIEPHQPVSDQPPSHDLRSSAEESPLDPLAQDSGEQELGLINRYGNEEHLTEKDVFDLVTGESEVQDKISDNDGNGQDLPSDQIAKSKVEDSEAQELDLIDQYGLENRDVPAPEPSTAATDTAHEVQKILEGGSNPLTPSREGEVNSPTAIEDSLLYTAPESDQIEPRLTKENEAKESNEALSSNQLLEDPEADWDASKKKKGKKSKKSKALSFDNYGAEDPVQTSTPPAEKASLKPEDLVPEFVEDSITKKSKKDKKGKKKGFVGSAIDYEVPTPPEVRGIEAEGADDLQDKTVTPPLGDLPPNEAIVTEKSSHDVESLILTEPSEDFEVEEQTYEAVTSSFQIPNPAKAKKDKKKSKKGKQLAWEDEVDTAPEADDKSLAEAKNLEADNANDLSSVDPGLIVESKEVTEDIPKSKKDRKKTLKAKGLVQEDEFTTASSEPVQDQEAAQRDQEPRIEGSSDTTTTVRDDLTTVDEKDSAPIYEGSSFDMKDSLPETSLEDSDMAPPGFTQPATVSEGQHVQSAESMTLNEPSIDTEIFPTYSLKKSKKDKKKGKKNQQSDPKVDERQEEAESTTEVPPSSNDQEGPSVVQMPDDPGDWSREEKLTEQIEPTEVIEPGDTAFEEQIASEARLLSAPTEESDPRIEAGDEDYAPVKKSKKDKKKKGKKAQQFDPDVEARREEAQFTAGEPPISMAQDGPTIVPMSDDPGDWTREENSAEQIEPTEVVEPADTATFDEQVVSESHLPSVSIEESIEAGEEDFATVKKSKKSKKSKIKNRTVAEPEVEAPSLLETTVPSSTVEPAHDDGFPKEKEVFAEPNIQASTSESQEAEPLAPLEADEIGTAPADDTLWDVPSKMKKKGKKQRGEAFDAQEEPATQGTSAVEAPELLQDAKESPPDALSISDPQLFEESSTARPIPIKGDELLDAQEQRLYDQQYLKELERQHVESPRSDRVELSTSAMENGHQEIELQDQYDPSFSYEGQQGYEAPYTNASIGDRELGSGLSDTQQHGSGEQDQDIELKREASDVPYKSPVTMPKSVEGSEPLGSLVLETTDDPSIAMPASAAESGPFVSEDQQPRNQEDVGDSARDDSEPSQIPTKDLPTPAAEVEMLDAQEQQKYDDEYAKELERQLSPLQSREPYEPPSEHTSHMPSPQPSLDSILEMPYEERRSLAKPPPLEDIIEESRSRSGSVQETPPDRKDDFYPIQPTKKSKKGKKGKKQQPIIWEDETATPPIDSEADRDSNQITDQNADPVTETPSPRDDTLPSDTGVPRQPIGLEEPIEDQMTEGGNFTSTTGHSSSIHVDPTHEQMEAEDYFTAHPQRHVEKDFGYKPEENEEFRRSLSTDLPRSVEEDSTNQELPVITEEPSFVDRQAHNREKPDLESLGDPHRPEATSTPLEEEPDESFSYAPTKKSKKGKKSKKRGTGDDLNFSTPDSERIANEPTVSRSPTKDSLDEADLPRQRSPRRTAHFEDSGTLVDEDITTGDDRSKAAGAAAGLGLAALAVQSLSRRDSKKGGKKGKKDKKDKKSSKWTDPEEETPSTGSPLRREEPVIEGIEQTQTPEHMSAIREWQENARQGQTSDQTSTVKAWQGLGATPPRSPINTTSYEPTAETTSPTDARDPTYSSRYRDSGINVSDSPLVSEDLPPHRTVRDSGYPETEPSPVVGQEPLHHEVPPGRRIDNIDDREIEQPTGDADVGHESRKHHRSTSRNPPNASANVEAVPDASTSTPKDRQRRARSYDSDDSADSGFDVQRRRRRQAMKREAREPSPVSSTTKDRSSALFNSSPSAREKIVDRSEEHQPSSQAESIQQEPSWSFDRATSPSAHMPQVEVPEELSSTPTSRAIPDPSTYSRLTGGAEEPPVSLFGGPIRHDEDVMSESRSPQTSEAKGRGRRLGTISEDSQERVQSPRSDSVTRSHLSTEGPLSRSRGSSEDQTRRSTDLERSRSRNTDQLSSRQSDLSNQPTSITRHTEGECRTASAGSMQSNNSIRAIIRTPDRVRSASGQSQRSSGTPPLRRVDRSASGDLRGASKLGEAKIRAKSSETDTSDLEPAINIPSSSTYDPVTDKGKSRADMADVYEGWGDVRAQSPMSPTRPPSMRKRHSMHLLDLETRLDQLVSENRLLQSQKSTAEKTVQDQARDHGQQRHAYEEALQEHKTYLVQKDSELNELKAILEEWQTKVTHLEEVNEGLASSRALDEEHEQRYSQLEAEHTHLQERHTELATGMEGLVQREVSSHLEAKNAELQRLREELESAKQQVRSLQQQLLTSRESEDFVERDEDYFDSQCQSLCQHVQQWVLRFSKFSDMRACYRCSEVRDETKVDRMENAILDGTDVDSYLQDRVKRRDVFMAVVMTMIFDYIFTRYLFGMDREQRQKLKNLEKTLQDIGPMSAVCKWRATTLTLLMKRDDFLRQRSTDTEAIVHEIYDTLATFLPPPSHLVAQIQDSLRKVINAAADLSIEMRCQRADYQMLPPLQPDYDTNGDLAQKVYFNALTMNERSGAITSNQTLQEQGAVVRMVLFPLVVKNEEDDEQIIVCPAQVLTADPKGKKTVRVLSVAGSMQGGRSEASFAGSDVHMEGGMI